MSSKTRTTYHPSTHPNWNAKEKKEKNDITIPIQLLSAPTYDELCAMRDEMIVSIASNFGGADAQNEDIHSDNFAMKQQLDKEIHRCRKLPVWQAKHQQYPTQHARIDPAQIEQLKDILEPQTLRRRFISVEALLQKIQSDLTTPRIYKI